MLHAQGTRQPQCLAVQLQGPIGLLDSKTLPAIDIKGRITGCPGAGVIGRCASGNKRKALAVVVPCKQLFQALLALPGLE